MKRYYWGVAVGALMFLAGLIRMAQLRGLEAQDPVLRVQQWSLMAGGVVVGVLARVAAKRPRNGGFGVLLASMAVMMSGGSAIPFHETAAALPGLVLGALGFVAGLYCMLPTRTGDA